jgi:hypothetical protein
VTNDFRYDRLAILLRALSDGGVGSLQQSQPELAGLYAGNPQRITRTHRRTYPGCLQAHPSYLDEDESTLFCYLSPFPTHREASSAALWVSLTRRNLIHKALASPASFLQLLESSHAIEEDAQQLGLFEDPI